MGLLPAATNRPSRSKTPKHWRAWARKGPPKGAREPPSDRPEDQNCVSCLGSTPVKPKTNQSDEKLPLQICTPLECQAHFGHAGRILAELGPKVVADGTGSSIAPMHQQSLARPNIRPFRDSLLFGQLQSQIQPQVMLKMCTVSDV